MKRPSMGLGVKLASALIALGFHPRAAAHAAGIKLPDMPPLLNDKTFGRDDVEIQWDHDPALALRPRDMVSEVGERVDYWPRANDPRFITPRAKPDHARKTDGNPAVPLSGDKSMIAKVARLERRNLERKIAECAAGLRMDIEVPAPKRPKRSWPKGRKITQRPYDKDHRR